MRKLLLGLVLLSLLQACIVVDNGYSVIPPGTWRGVLKLDRPIAQPLRDEADLDVRFEEVAKGELPFNFEVEYTDEAKFNIHFLNGEERITVAAEDITYGRNRATGKDSIVIKFPVFDSYISAFYEEDVIEGEWIVNNRENYRIPFVAFHGKGYRFTELKKDPVMDVSGKWKTTFGIETDEPYVAIGEFEQEGNQLTGTFRTETGDYRYLEGTVQADKLYLSVFDGAHAFLFEAKIQEDGKMIGSFRSGSHYKTLWEAERDEEFELASPDSLTYLTRDDFNFSFPSTAGETVSLADYGDKVKLVQIFGTWCPNCRDETNFLIDYLEEHPNDDLAVVALGFEKYREEEKAMRALNRFKDKMNVPYDVLLAGYSNKSEASEALPMLNRVISYPTLIFVDRNNQVRRIHTGFNGPATSEYQDFVEEFDTYLQSLLAESTATES
ncbi:MAG: TlpA disulfide reductase family protein [Bacteroidota bacterium]